MTPGEPIRAVIQAGGGLASLADLARRWGLSPTRLQQLSAEPDFPEPVARVDGGRRALFSIAECDQWKQARPGPGQRKAAA